MRAEAFTAGQRLLLGRLYQVQFQQQCRKATAALKESISSSPEALDEEWKTAKPFEQIPGNRSYPILGTSWAMLPIIGYGIEVERMMEIFRIQYKKFGPIWKDIMPGMPPIVSTVLPENAERLFRTEGKFPERPGFTSLQRYRATKAEQYSSMGILIAAGDQWWQIRSKAQQPMLKTKNVNSYVPILGQIGDEFIDRIRLIRQPNNEMKSDFINEMYRWALESVALVGLNTRLGCLSPDLAPDSEAQKMIKAANVSFTTVNQLENSFPFWKLFMTPKLKKLFQAQDFFTETTIKYINRTLENIKNRPADSDDDISILEELLIRGMSPKDAMVMVVDMLMAGIDTTSHTTSFLLYLLAKNPEKQEILRREVLSVVGPKGTPVTVGALNELHYLKACVKESLRVQPATVGNARIIDKNLVLSGYQIPKGTLVLVLSQLMSELEEFFPRPRDFVPERWIKGDPQESFHNPYTLLPFGHGTRMCIGRRLAELEMWQLTIKLLQNFRIEYHHEDIGSLTRLVNTPDQPLRFKFIDLKN